MYMIVIFLSLCHNKDNAIKQYKAKDRCSNEQNVISLAKLDYYRENALGMGLRSVIKSLERIANGGNEEAETCLHLMEVEFANLSAKKIHVKKKVIYKRKDILLSLISEMLYNNGGNAAFQLTLARTHHILYMSIFLTGPSFPGIATITRSSIVTIISNALGMEFHARLLRNC